jgi:hypothetical protein
MILLLLALAAPLRLGVYGDAHVGNGWHEKVTAAMLAEDSVKPFAAVLTGGDNTSNGSQYPQWRAMDSALMEDKILVASMGSHDWGWGAGERACAGW